MWPVIYAFGTRFSSALVLPFAAVIGTIGYYVEKKLLPKQKPVDYLGASIQEQREQRLQTAGNDEKIADSPRLPDTLGVLKPSPAD